MPRRKYDTPHRSRVVKTRMTEEEYADFAARLAPYGISQSEFIRRAIQGASIRPVFTVSPVNDELLHVRRYYQNIYVRRCGPNEHE